MNSFNIRYAFDEQNGQCLIVDIAEMQTESINNLIKVLQDVFTLACSLRGGLRVPGFSLSVLTQINNVRYQYDTICGQFSKIQAAINSILEFGKINEKISLQDYKDGIYSALNSIMTKVKQRKNDGLSKECIEITFVTVKDCDVIRTYFDSFILQLEDLSKINKISIIELKQEEIENIENKCGILETIKMNAKNTRHLENFFKRWLLDQSSGADIILHFPTKDNSTISVKCDVEECILNPFSLPFASRACLQTDCLNTQFREVSAFKTTNKHIPVYELNIVSRLACNAICESTIFGMPLCLRSAKLPKLSLDEEEANEDYFSEICTHLIDSDEFLLARMRSHSQTDLFMPYFVLTAGESCLLLKSFASSDFTLPKKHENISIERNERKLKLCDAIHNLKCEDDLSPHKYDSGLYLALRANLKSLKRDFSFDHNAPSTSGIKRFKRN